MQKGQLILKCSDEPKLEFSGSSRAELGHFNFRAETELNRNFFNSFFPPSFYYQKSCIMISAMIPIDFIIIYLNFCVFEGENLIDF